jgi:hypothetical protein
MSQRKWRLRDLAAMHHFLRAGVGFGMLPQHMVQADLTSLFDQPASGTGRTLVHRSPQRGSSGPSCQGGSVGGLNQPNSAREAQSRAPASNGGVIARSCGPYPFDVHRRLDAATASRGLLDGISPDNHWPNSFTILFVRDRPAARSSDRV